MSPEAARGRTRWILSFKLGGDQSRLTWNVLDGGSGFDAIVITDYEFGNQIAYRNAQDARAQIPRVVGEQKPRMRLLENRRCIGLNIFGLSILAPRFHQSVSRARLNRNPV